MKVTESTSTYLIKFALFVGLSTLAMACGLFQTGNKYDPDPEKKPILEIDPNFGVQYYLDQDLVQDFPLPNGFISKMVLVPGGEFIMGLNDEDPLGIQPSGNVRIAVNAFWIDQFEVTNGQYRAYLEELAEDERALMMPDSIAWAKEVGVPWRVYFYDEGFANYPVVCVTWHQANKYAQWAGKRLPSEAEWEYAARSGVSGRIYPWEGIYSRNAITGESLANFAPNGDYALDGYVITAPVGSFPPNNFRLYDMAGNVSEWCQDAYFASYKVLKMATRQLVTPTYNNPMETRKVVRGGSWASNEYFIGVGVRDYRFAGHASPRIGFRLAMDANNPIVQRRARDGFLLRTGQIVNPNAVKYTKATAEDPNPTPTKQPVKKSGLAKLWESITGIFKGGNNKAQTPTTTTNN